MNIPPRPNLTRSTRRVIPWLLGALLAACGGQDAPEPAPVMIPQGEITPNVYVGKVEGGQALIALVEGAEGLVAYTCGVGERRTTHTGWYYGLRASGEVHLSSGGAGLRLDGQLSQNGGQGTLALADGQELRWSVEPARGSAGLYDFEDAARWVGFIQTNTGETAGNLVSRVSGIGVATGTTTPTTGTVSPTTPPPTSPAPTPVAVNDGGTTSTVTVTPVQTADTKIITRSGPTVVFLLHGMSDNIGTKVAGDPEDPVECSGPRDTPFYGRCEWGPDFLPGLFGSTNLNTPLINFAGQNVTGQSFVNNPSNRPLFDENLGQTLAGECLQDPSQAEVYDPKTATHFITTGTSKPKVAPQLSAFVTWRDSTRGLVESGRRATRQIYAALRWYEKQFNVTPGVILLGQSFGGLASRFLLSKPDPKTLSSTLNEDKIPLCKEDLAKMDYIRDRTLYLTTLATPHEGSYLAEWGVPAKEHLNKLLSELQSGVSTLDTSTVIRNFQQVAPVLQPSSRDAVQGSIQAIEELKLALNTSALRDLQLDRMKQVNLGPLEPSKARRTGASPIVGAAKTLVPIYVTLGRSPGTDSFDGPDIVAGIKKHASKRPKAQGWTLGTMFFADLLTRQFIPGGFGDATAAPYGPHQNILDRRKRIFDASKTVDQIEQQFGNDIEQILAAVSPWFLGKFGRNADAVLRSLQRANVSVTLPTPILPIHTAQNWRIGFNGATQQVPIPALACGGTQIRLDYDALARLLVDKFNDTEAVLGAIQSKDLNGILEAVSLSAASDKQFAEGVASWFLGKIGQLASLPAECNALPDSPLDLFSVAELANWRVVSSTGSIPVPSWIGMGGPVSDGEMDHDGAVHSASALGFTLGREPFFFEHDRADDGGKFASWYRLHTNPDTERFHHGLQYENRVGVWYNKTFIGPKVGPVAQRDGFSVWIE